MSERIGLGDEDSESAGRKVFQVYLRSPNFRLA